MFHFLFREQKEYFENVLGKEIEILVLTILHTLVTFSKMKLLILLFIIILFSSNFVFKPWECSDWSKSFAKHSIIHNFVSKQK